MHYQINLGLRQQTVPFKIENGRNILKMMSNSSFFAAPNPLPHPTLASIDAIIDDLETAYQQKQGGGKVATQVLKKNVLAYNDAINELAHYVVDLANANTSQATAIILAAGMNRKRVTKPYIPDFSVKHSALSGSVILRVKATKRAVYVFEISTATNGSLDDLVWKIVSIGSKAKITVSDLTSSTTYYFRYAKVIKIVPQDFSEALSIVVG